MIDAIYWNDEVRQPHEAKINPDPDGYLATQFLDLTLEFDKLMRPALEGMKKHEARFGWPGVIGDK